MMKDVKCSTRVRELIDRLDQGKVRDREVLALMDACLDRSFQEDFEVGLTLDQAVEFQRKVSILFKAVTNFTMCIIEDATLAEILGLDAVIIENEE